MSEDLQMVRSQDGAGWNLAIGEPVFLQDEFWFARAAVAIDSCLYPCVRGESELLYELEHHSPGTYAVVCNGAKQALSAAIYACLTQKGFTPGKHPVVHHRAPYWPSFPYLVKHEGAVFDSESVPTGVTVKISTSPNNPDGSLSTESVDIADHVYALPVYGYRNDRERDLEMYRIEILSAAKMLGLSGLRVGWALTKDKELADLMAGYVERFTSGVCTQAQLQVAATLRHIRHHNAEMWPLVDRARGTLLRNGDAVNHYLGLFCDKIEGVPGNGMGMFAWIHVTPEWFPAFQAGLQKSGVKVIRGLACGVIETGWYRLSMGQRNEYTQNALKALCAATTESRP